MALPLGRKFSGKPIRETQAFFEHVYQGPLFPRAQLESIEQTNQHPVYFGALPRPIR